jgi:hypothetical protein
MNVMASKTAKAIAAIACLGSVLLSSRPAQASACWSPAETGALKVRQMQVYLMVTSLQCTMRGDANMRTAYNRYVRNSGPELVTNAAVLKIRFAADHGGQGVAQFDRYMTQLANGFASDPVAAADCARVSAVADQAAGENAAGLIDLANQLFPDADRSDPACTSPSRLAGLKID